jgi:hypothetical protein
LSVSTTDALQMRNEHPNLIYIVKPEDVPQPPKTSDTYPNFTIPGNAEVKVAPTTSAQDLLKPALTGLTLRMATLFAARAALSVTPVGLPITLLVAVATYSPAIMQLFTKNKGELPKDIEEGLEKIGKEDVEAFMRDHAYSIQMVEQDGLVFPPGHPQTGKVYQRHPLAAVKSATKAHIFIPAERYDELLLEEREAELLRLLVHLGATKITIAKKRRMTRSSKFEGTVSGSAAVVGGDIAAAGTSQWATDNADTRVFELAGKEWRHGETLDRSQFAWASFEPSWDALIVAREIGGCLQADLEVREITTFSSDRNLTASVAAKLYKGSAALGATSDNEEENFYLVKAQFGTPRRAPATLGLESSAQRADARISASDDREGTAISLL